MDKIPFQDGTKISSAKVTIDGVDYPVTPARYTGATPLSSTVLNTMQDNIEDAIYQNADNIGGQDYDSTATYEEGDIVKYEGQLYICIEAIDTPEEWDSTKWTATDVLSSAGGNEVAIGDSTTITSKTKIFIDESEGTDAYSEVVNSLSGNEIAKAPSVRAVNGASVIVSPTEPTGNERRKVWKQHENIFDNTSPQTFSNTTTLSPISSGIRATVTTSGTNTSSLACIDIGAISDFVGKKITVKFKNNSSTNKGRIYLGKSNVGQTNRQLIVDSGTIENGTHIIQTDTITNDTSYPRLFLAIYGNGTDISVNVNTYVDYTNFVVSTIEDKEYILNNNVYEEFTPQNEVYSTSETKIGTWLGKPLYRKLVNVGNLPNSTDKIMSHGISNINFITNMSGVYYNSNSKYTMGLNLLWTDGGIRTTADASNIYINTTRDYSLYIGNLILEYTKTTD